MTGAQGEENVVRIHPNTLCSCRATSCWHVLAVKISVGVRPETPMRQVSLSPILDKKRVKGGKSGRKAPRLGDVQPLLFEAAPDSVTAEAASDEEVKMEAAHSHLFSP